MAKGHTIPGPNGTYWMDHRCGPCHCTFTYEKKNLQLIKYTLYVEKYRLHCDYLNNTFALGIFDEILMARYKDVYTCDFVPNLTPQNALDKVKTILVFQ